MCFKMGLECKICGSYNFRPRNYPLIECKDCGLVFVSDPEKIDPETYYNKEYYFKWEKDMEKNLNKRKFAARKKQEIFFKNTKDIKFGREKILDVGCSLGEFVKEMDRFFDKVRGIEISSFAVDFAKNRDVPISYGTLPRNDFQYNSFDVITLWEVIEHLSNPLEDLKSAYKLLKHGGILYITTPNYNSLNRKILGEKWSLFLPSEHLFYFTPKTLKHLLEVCGFKVIETLPSNRDFKYPMFSLYPILKHFLKKEDEPLIQKIKDKGKLTLKEKIIDSVYRTLCWSITPSINTLLLGDHFTIIAQKIPK